MRTIISFFILMLTFSLAAQKNNIIYTESFEDFPNPERGFYRYSSTYASPYSNLKESIIKQYRDLHRPYSADYKIYSTLVFRYFFLDDFVNTPITQDFLDNMEEDFEVLRKSGLKVIARFAYTETVNSEGCSSWICPPYGDASKERVLEHISQLKPILHDNKDVIAVVQLGFIGVWGEGYYTDYFGDASQSPYILNTQNWMDRNEVLTALLDAVPEERQVQVRYPQIKQRNVYGVNAPTSSLPLTKEEAHNGSAKARIGHHNDCFLASSTDFGTYNDYGPPSSKSDTITLKPYLANDSRFLAIGGETCSSYNPYDDCASGGGRADTEMRRFHYSYLNSQYNNNAVNNEWVDQGCIDEIKRELGYRFVLLEGEYDDEVEAGQKMDISFSLTNVGYAPPYNPRAIELILRENTQKLSYRVKLEDLDPRFWESDLIQNINLSICLPGDVPVGEYELLLNLPDPELSLHDNKDFSIRLANESVWEEITGYNSLMHTVQVNPEQNPDDCEGEIIFETTQFFSQLQEQIKNDHFQVYPNPTDSKLWVETNIDPVRNSVINILSTLGEKIAAFTMEHRGQWIDLSGFNSGSYIIQFHSEGQIFTEKLIISH